MSIEREFEKLKQIFEGGMGNTQIFNPPATDEDFAELKKVTGVTVRGGLRKIWLLANGAKQDVHIFDAWVEQERNSICCDFLSISESIRLWKMAHDFEGGGRGGGRSSKVKGGWFRKRWIPFASLNVSSTILYYDADPSVHGINGQIIVYDDDWEFVHWHSTTFGEFFKKSNPLLMERRESISE